MNGHDTSARLAEEMTEFGTVTRTGTNRVSVITTDDVADVLESIQDRAGAVCVGCDEVSEKLRNVVIDTSGAVGPARPDRCDQCAPALPCSEHL